MVAHYCIIVAILLVGVDASAEKRGLSGLDTCNDGTVLGLGHSWNYNWGLMPKQIPQCSSPRTAEFCPMFWSCGTNCTSRLPDNYTAVWRGLGVKYILGFNEPDNTGQANMLPAKAAESWSQLQAVAQAYGAELVSPAMTHWSINGSAWLDQFFGNCTIIPDCDPSSIKYIAFHDYSGSANAIVEKAKAAYARYGRKVWLTEFAVGSGKSRPINDEFMRKLLPLLDSTEAVFRYAWFSTRNAPGSWVNASSLLPWNNGWITRSHTTCKSMHWLSQHGSLQDCKDTAIAHPECVSPKTLAYEGGPTHNCLCANSTCQEAPSSWLDLYIETTPEKKYMVPTSTGMIYKVQANSQPEIEV